MPVEVPNDCPSILGFQWSTIEHIKTEESAHNTPPIPVILLNASGSIEPLVRSGIQANVESKASLHSVRRVRANQAINL